MPWSATAPRKSSVRNRCVSTTVAARTRRPSGRDFTVSPATTDIVMSAYAVRPVARARIQNVGSLIHDVLVIVTGGSETTCTDGAAATGARATEAAAVTAACARRAAAISTWRVRSRAR